MKDGGLGQWNLDPGVRGEGRGAWAVEFGSGGEG